MGLFTSDYEQRGVSENHRIKVPHPKIAAKNSEMQGCVGRAKQVKDLQSFSHRSYGAASGTFILWFLETPRSYARDTGCIRM